MEDPPPSLLLPDDVLARVLARLAPRCLAVSRCVSREWRAVVDDRHLLRLDLLPLTVGGIFVESRATETRPDFFARPPMTRSRWVAGRLMSFVRMDDGFDADLTEIVDCCNGLFLLQEYEAIVIVVNPATSRSVRLPPTNGLPEGGEGLDDLCYRFYLAFDPMVSPHYEVISMQHPFNLLANEKKLWPPQVYLLHAYSSRTGRWEERRFALDDGEGLQRSIDGVSVRTDGHAAYWRGVLYVHDNYHFIMRISLSDDKYQVIDLPTDATASDDSCEVYLGKSKNGIYLTAMVYETYQVLIWFLDESGGKAQWVLKHEVNLHDLVTYFSNTPDAQTDRPWTLQDSHSQKEFNRGLEVEVEKNLRNLNWESDDNESAIDIKDYCDPTVKDKDVDWDNDNEGVVDIKEYSENPYEFTILGFHPYREIVFLYSSRVVAYHFNTSKVRDLGELGLKYFERIGSTTFIYAPCWVGDLSETS